VVSARGPGAVGTIAAIDGTTLTVEDEAGTTTTVTTDDETTVTDTAEGELADIAVGDQISAMGEADDEGVVTADRVMEGELDAGPRMAAGGPPPGAGNVEPPPDGAVVRGGPGGGAVGEVTAIDGDTITVTTEEGDEVTVLTTEDTAVTVTTEIALSDLAVGDTVAVLGAEDGDAVAADSIRRGAVVFEGPRR
jgi:hypothetical protein